MPSANQNAELLQKLKAANLLSAVTPLLGSTPAAPTPTAPAYPNEPNPRLRTPMPASTVFQPDVQRQFLNPAIPQTRIMPQTASANPIAGAASATQAATVINNVTNETNTTITNVTSTGDLNWRGQWVSSTKYNIDDVVLFNISAYVALTVSTNVEPDGNPIQWQLLSKNINIRGNFVGLISGISVNEASSPSPNAPSTVSLTTTLNNEYVMGFTTTFVNGTTVFTGGFTQLPGSYWPVPNSPEQVFQIAPTPTTLTYATSDLHMNSIGWTASQYVSALLGFSATPTIVQGRSISNTSPIAFSSNLTAGNTILVVIMAPRSVTIGSNFTVTDTQGNSYQELFFSFSPIGFVGHSYIAAFVAYNCAGGANTVTFTQNGGTFSDTLPTILELSFSSIGVQYYPSDVVLYQGNTYICIKKTTSLVEQPTNTTFWTKLAGSAPPGDSYVLGVSDLTNLPNSIVNPTSYYGILAAPNVAGSIDDEFNGSQFNIAAWSWMNQVTATASVSNSLLTMQDALQGSGGTIVRAIYQPAPGTPWQVLVGPFQYSGSYANFNGYGIFVSDGTKLDLLTCNVDTTSGHGEQIGVFQFTNTTTFSATKALSPFTAAFVGSVWNLARYMSIKDNGVTLFFYISPDGVNFWQIYSEARTSFLANVSRVGIFLYPNAPTTGSGPTQIQQSNATVSVDFFRRIL